MQNPDQMVEAKNDIVILFDPPSLHYHKNRFFDLDSPLNRDSTLRPNYELKWQLQNYGYPVFTADMLEEIRPFYPGCQFHYWGFGAPASRALSFHGVNLNKIGVALFEPPLVKPADYAAINSLTKTFRKVFLHNIIGDGYKLPNDGEFAKINKLFWTNRNYQDGNTNLASAERLAQFAMIAGAHFRKASASNGYGKRLQAIEFLASQHKLDLFGFGWRRFQIRSPMASLLWKFKLYRYGWDVPSPVNKHDVYRKYDFAICFENMAMSGYVTEKLFDALFSSCIPVYWGAPDIAKYVPEECYIKLDDFPKMQDCFDHCMGLSAAEKTAYRHAIKQFLSSSEFAKFDSGFHGQIATFYGADKHSLANSKSDNQGDTR